MDLFLARYDVIGNIAHSKMLAAIGILSKAELEKIIPALENILKDIEAGNFTIEENFEDVHSKVEYLLTEKLGDVAGENEQNLIPGYTHLQIAMPSSVGLWLSAYAEILVDDMQFLNAAFAIADQNPLGTAAGYGSSFPVDRQMTTDLLGFGNLKVNAVAAQLTRGKLEKSIAIGLSGVATTLSKMCMDICLYMSQNFGFISFPDELTTGSSIMPHKKNPDVFELLRAKCNQLQALPVEFTMVTNNLPSGYHRDFQLLKEMLVPSFEKMADCLDILCYAMPQMTVKKNIVNDPKYDYMFSVEVVNDLVKQGVPFRTAYKEVATQIATGKFKPNYDLNHQHIGSIGNLSLEKIIAKMEAVL
uniref:Argininosuccinate lyase n=1 Tax=Stylophora pistillata TaxID=50429 RepID=A0A2B4R8M7_STYPI